MSFSQNNNNKLPSNLPQLQNLIKRDPESYHEEFCRQYAVYEATKAIFEQSPSLNNSSLHELVMFFSQIAHCYTDDLKDFPEDLVSILERHGSSLHPSMRFVFVKALVLLRNKNLLSPTALLSLFFRLLQSQDKNLRKFLKDHIITDIKNINSKGKNMKLNKELQNFMFEMLKDNHAVAIKTSLDVMIDLYKKQVWNDAKTVNIIASACFSKITKVMVAAVKFFVSVDDELDESSDSESEDDMPSLQQVRLAARVNKKKTKNIKKEEKVKKALKNKQKKNKQKAQFDFSAIHLIHDPQNLAEKLYRKLEKMNERFEVKLLVMNFISRLVGIHELYLPNFYAYLQRFLFVKQRDVTKIMTYVAQAAHPLVPPDDLEPVLKTLANNFVTERYSGEVMAMGLNAIRELCARNPYCMDEDLLQDLVGYKSHKDKSVVMASRSLITVFREKNPQLLAKKDRGAPTELSKETQLRRFGEIQAKDFIPGAEVLTFKMPEKPKKRRDVDDDDDEDEWEDLSDSEEESDEEKQKQAKKENNPQDNEERIYTKREAIQEVMKMTPEERAEKAKDILTTRLLTDEDFARIAAAQAAKQVERYSSSRKRSKKRKLQEEEETTENSDIVRLSSIEMVHKKRCHDRDARTLSVLEGREGREKFGSRKGRMNPFASTTNKEKGKSKSYMMMKHKIRSGKQKLSFRERQIKLRNGLLKAKLS
ncbi:Protein SDA1-like protein [Armadillidium vulgare]|nr:Protein SDA1-like protein [Armadillidium vulgare]